MKTKKHAKARKAAKPLKSSSAAAKGKSNTKEICPDELNARCSLALAKLTAKEEMYNEWKTSNAAEREACVESRQAIEDGIRDVNTLAVRILVEPQNRTGALSLQQQVELNQRLAMRSRLEVGLLRYARKITFLEDDDAEVARGLRAIGIGRAYWTRRRDTIMKKLGGESSTRRRMMGAAFEVESTGPLVTAMRDRPD